MKKLTLKQIAKELNLSTSTVSRAMSNDYQISQATKEMVVAYASGRGYRVDRFAKGLRMGRTMTIGVVVCFLDNAFMVQVVNGVSDVCMAMGYQLLIMQSRGSFEEEKQCVNMLLDSRVDGILISPSFNSTDLTYLADIQQAGLPIVLFDRISGQLKTHQVGVDNFAGGAGAARHLIQKGFKRVLAISCQTNILLSSERLDGFVDTMLAKQETDRRCLVESCDPAEPVELQARLKLIFKKIFMESPRAEAVFATTDSLTSMSLKVMDELNLRVPLIGFCNSDLAGILIGKPATIVQPAQELGMLACRQLISLFEDNACQQYQTIYLPTRLVER